MHWDLKSLLRSQTTRPSSPADSGSTIYSTTTPSAKSLSINDRYPFPTSPSRVRKARHSNHPQYLPRPDASARDVQYFLYTLLTSKAHECAKKYPEWVLETCMSWKGDGNQLRSCTEEQLATLCPYQATVSGIDSTKHQPGAFVPIPARYMIGQVIARFVAEKKSREKQIEDVHTRLEEERRRSSMPMRTHPGLESMKESAPSRAASQRSRAQPILPTVRSERQTVDSFSPVVWAEPAGAMRGAFVLDSTTIPTHMFSEPNASGATNSFPYEQLSISPASSITLNSLYYDMPSALGQSNGHLNGTQQQTQPRRPIPHSSLELSKESYGLNVPDTNTSNPSLPQRYAPRRPSSLRASSTSKHDQASTICNTVPLRRTQAVHTFDSNSCTVPSRRPMSSLRRRSSLATSKLAGDAIPEAIDEQSASLSHSEESQQNMRHDSGVENSPYSISPSSSSHSAFLTEASAHSLPTTSAAPNLSRSSTVELRQQHHAWAGPGSYSTLPVPKQLARSVSFDLTQYGAHSPITPPSSRVSKQDLPIESRPSVLEQDRSGRSGDKDMSEDYEAVEAEFQRLKRLRDATVTRIPTPPPQPLLRKAQSEKTLYSFLDPMQGMSTGQKPWRIKPTASQVPPETTAEPHAGRSQFRDPTLIEVIEDQQAYGARSLVMQEYQRRRYADGVASE